MNRLLLTSIAFLSMSGAASAQSATAFAEDAPAKVASAAPAPVVVALEPAAVTPAPAPAPQPIVMASAAAAAAAATPEQTPQRDAIAAPTQFPKVTFGALSYLQFAAELHESDGYNAFDVTRGYFNVRAQLNERVRVRFTPDVRPTTDASLDRNLALRLEYASLDVQVADNVIVMFGLHETPWLTFEETLNRYRVIGPLFAERLELIPGATDLGASIKANFGRTDVHVGVYNGEGYGRAEVDKYKSIDSRATFRPFAEDGELGNVTISGFYQYGWYAQDRPRNVAIVMGSYENPHFVGTAQYLSATDNPFVAVDVKRRGLSFFGEGRQGVTGWAGIFGLDIFVPNAENDGDSRRRTTFGGAHWSEVGRGRLGIVVSLQQESQTNNGQLLERRLLVQTHIEF